MGGVQCDCPVGDLVDCTVAVSLNIHPLYYIITSFWENTFSN